MLEFELNDNSYKCPDKWEELSSEQYLFLSDLLLQYSLGKISVTEVRAKLLQKLLQLDFKRLPKGSLLFENMYLISRQLTFMFKIVYEDQKQFSFFSEDTQKMLERYLPEDLYPSPEIELAEQMKCHFAIDAVFAKNLLPQAGGVQGYEFDVEGGFVSTTLTAEQYVQAVTLYGAYVKSGNQEQLEMLANTLYPDGENFTEAELHGVFLNFGAIQTFLYNTKYGILWQRKSTGKNNKLTVGLMDSVYTLSSEGYGNLVEVKNYNLITYLDLLLKQLIDSVKTLQSYELKLPEIAEKTGLSIEQLNTIV